MKSGHHRTTTRSIPLALGLVAALGLAAAPGWAQDTTAAPGDSARAAMPLGSTVPARPAPKAAARPGFVGSWVFAPDRSDDIHAAIEKGIDGMNFITKPIGRRRLRATNDPYRTIVVRHEDGSFATAFDGRAFIRSPDDGTVVKWTREDGEVLDLSTVMKGDTLVQTFVADDGSRENDYALSADGAVLSLHVTVRSPRLPRPVVYTLVYDRRP